jgi:hypothetical protein
MVVLVWSPACNAVKDSGRVRLLPNRLVSWGPEDLAVRQEPHPPQDSKHRQIQKTLRIRVPKSFTASPRRRIVSPLASVIWGEGR